MNHGRRRQLKEQRRKVHAFAVGGLVDYVHPCDDRQLAGINGRAVAYNPNEFALFYDRLTQDRVTTAELVHLDEQGASYA